MSTLALPPLPGLVPCARQQIVPVVEQQQLARDTYRLRLAAPELAQSVTPGQFFMVRAPGLTSPLLGRPFALYDIWLDDSGNCAGIDLVYLVVGKMTGLMRTWQANDPVEVWGPLGNGFPLPDCDRLLMVAGGIGNTPFPAVTREALGLRRYGDAARRLPHSLAARNVTFCYGGRSAEYLAGIPEFEALDIDLRLATDDGSRGHKGLVTDLVSAWLNERVPANEPAKAREKLAIYCCGPEPMMHAVAKLAARHAVPCWLSLETPMACGFGACFSCVTRVKQPDGDWDYRRVCVEGPVFPAESLEW